MVEKKAVKEVSKTKAAQPKKDEKPTASAKSVKEVLNSKKPEPKEKTTKPSAASKAIKDAIDFASKRKFPRLRLTPDDAKKERYPFKDLVKSISGGGCFVETDRDLEIGSTYELEFAHPKEKKTYVIKGVIVWKTEGIFDKKNKKNLIGYGIQFDEGTKPIAARLMDLVLQHKFFNLFE